MTGANPSGDGCGDDDARPAGPGSALRATLAARYSAETIQQSAASVAAPDLAPAAGSVVPKEIKKRMTWNDARTLALVKQAAASRLLNQKHGEKGGSWDAAVVALGQNEVFAGCTVRVDTCKIKLQKLLDDHRKYEQNAPFRSGADDEVVDEQKRILTTLVQLQDDSEAQASSTL